MANKKVKLEDRMTDEQKLISNISGFFEKNIKLIAIIFAALFVALLIVVIIASSSSSKREDNLVAVSELEDKVSLVVSSGEGIDELINDLKNLVVDSSYASQKAQYLVGIINSSLKKDREAYDAFIKCANINKKVYLAKLAVLNAAVSLDNLGEFDAAINLYNQLVGLDNIGIASRALFNIGRIYYQQNKIDLAKSTFETLIGTYADSELSKVAKNFIDMMN